MEQITGKPFEIKTLLDNYLFFYCMILANNKDKEKILHEKDIDDDNGSYSETSLPNNMNPSPNPTATRVGPNAPSSKVIPKPSVTNPPNKPMTESDENNLQYLRDVAAGKYDEF